jgi:hypothetical protein
MVSLLSEMRSVILESSIIIRLTNFSQGNNSAERSGAMAQPRLHLTAFGAGTLRHYVEFGAVIS